METASLQMDTYKIVQLLQSRGYSKEQAEGFLETIQEITFSGVATRQDMAEVMARIATLSTDIQKDNKDIHAELTDIRSDELEIKTGTHQKIAELKSWFMGIMLTQSLAIIAFIFALFQFYLK